MSDSNVRTVLELYKKGDVTIDQAVNLLAAVMIDNAMTPSATYNSNNWTYTTTWDESLSTEQE
jgi:hypothetical protein